MTTKKPTFLNRVYAMFGTKTKKHTARRAGKKLAKKATKHVTKHKKTTKAKKMGKTKKRMMKGGMVRAGSRPDTWPARS